jgi:hypothetical protein
MTCVPVFQGCVSLVPIRWRGRQCLSVSCRFLANRVGAIRLLLTKGQALRSTMRFVVSVLTIAVAALGLTGVGALTQSANATTATVPSAPLQVYVSNAASTSRVVTWTAPVSDGGAAISDYTIETREVGTLTWVPVSHAPASSTSIEVSSLSTTATYVARVRAINSEGFGPWNITGSRIDGGREFACAVVSDGTVQCWGDNI